MTWFFHTLKAGAVAPAFLRLRERLDIVIFPCLCYIIS